MNEVVDTLKRLEHEGYHFEVADASLELLMRRADRLGAAVVRGRVVPGDHRRPRPVLGPSGDAARNGVSTEATIKVHVGGERVVATAEGNGPVTRSTRRCAVRSATGARASSACTSPTTRFGCSTRRRAPARSRGCSSTAPNGDRVWTTIGVSENIIEASWQALYDSLVFGLLAHQRRAATQARLRPCRPTRSLPASPRRRTRARSRTSRRASTSRRPAPWRAHRPGDESRSRSRTASSSARPGPNIGYALTLAHRARDRFALAPHEHVEDAVGVVGELAMKRAASYGRAPVMPDVECAMLVLGYQGGCASRLRRVARDDVEGAHHEYARRRVLVRRRRRSTRSASRRGARRSRVEEVRAQLREAVEAARAPALIARPSEITDVACQGRRYDPGRDEHVPAVDRARRAPAGSCAASPRSRSRRYAAEADERSEYPWKSFEAYRDSGFIRIPYPAEHGGDGADSVAYAILVEEVARVCASSSLFVLHLAPRVRADPRPRLRRARGAGRHRRSSPGDWQGSYCLSEPNAGSDVGAMTTRAVRDGDHYVLNGRKAWITNAGISDFYTVFASDRSGSRAARGISAFVVERDTPGLSVGKLETKLGMRGSPTGELLLDDVVVPAENLIGEEGAALRYAMQALDGSRPIVGAQAVGIAQGALDVAARYVKERPQFGTAIADFQGIQFMLADMATRSRRRACSCTGPARWSTPAPRACRKAASMAKLFASDAAMAVTTDAVQLLGGAGYTPRLPGRADDARREGHPDLRGHEPDPAHRGRPPPARRGRRTPAEAPPSPAGATCPSRSAGPLLAGADRLAARRLRPHRALQLPLRPPPRRHVRPAHRGHRPEPARATSGSSGIQDSLRWLGLDWDEGPVLQSQRFAEYRVAADQLLETGHAYECFCTPEELEERTAAARAAGRPPGYDGHCRDLSPEQRAALPREGRPRTLRFRTPDDGVSRSSTRSAVRSGWSGRRSPTSSSCAPTAARSSSSRTPSTTSRCASRT